MRLITQQQVLDKAFTNTEDVDIDLIKDAVIEATQLRWVLPVLGGDLWDELVTQDDASTTTVLNTTLKSKLVTCMAFFVKYEILPDMSINQTSAGLQVINTEFSNAATDKQRGEIRDVALIQAQTHLKEFLRWLEDDTVISDYPLYLPSTNVKNSYSRKGGLVL